MLQNVLKWFMTGDLIMDIYVPFEEERLRKDRES